MSNLLRTIQQVTRDYVDSISHRLPSIKNGTVTATSSDGTATVRVDGDTATTASVPSIAAVKTGDRVKMVLFNRQLTILGAIQTRQHDTGWVPLEPANSNYYKSHAYVRRVNGIAFFRGNFEKVDGSGVVNGNLVTTIPTGFRPANSLTTILAGVGGTGDQSAYKVSVAWTGGVTVNANLSTNTANKYLWVSGITYPLG